MEIERVGSEEQISDVAALARQVWTDHYVPIIGQAQVDYMLEKFQSEEGIAGQLAEGYEYYMVREDGRGVGYLAVMPDADACMLTSMNWPSPVTP